MTRTERIPFWPDSNEPPLDRERYAARQRERGHPVTEEHIDRQEQAAISQRLWLMNVRGVEPVWRDRT